MGELVVIALATFWVWETLRFALERYTVTGRIFSATRVVHPAIVALLPLYLLWPNWVAALAVAGAVGLMDTALSRFVGSEPVQQLPVQRRRSTGGLPPLP